MASEFIIDPATATNLQFKKPVVWTMKFNDSNPIRGVECFICAVNDGMQPSKFYRIMRRVLLGERWSKK